MTEGLLSTLFGNVSGDQHCWQQSHFSTEGPCKATYLGMGRAKMQGKRLHVSSACTRPARVHVP